MADKRGTCQLYVGKRKAFGGERHPPRLTPQRHGAHCLRPTCAQTQPTHIPAFILYPAKNANFQAVLDELSELNKAYMDKNGFVFLICATGKPADTILAALKERLPNDRDTEVIYALVRTTYVRIAFSNESETLRCPPLPPSIYRSGFSSHAIYSLFRT